MPQKTLLPPAADVTGLILAAGEGRRLGGCNKAFVSLNGVSFLDLAVALLRPFCGVLIVGCREVELSAFHQALMRSSNTDSVHLFPGGRTRQETLELLLGQATTPLLLVHEVARPYASADLCQRVLAAARRAPAVIPAIALRERDSLARLRTAPDGGRHVETILPRSEVACLQTPQAYHRPLLLDAYAAARRGRRDYESTAALVQAAGHGIEVVAGESENLKVTHRCDLPAVMSLTPPARRAG